MADTVFRIMTINVRLSSFDEKIPAARWPARKPALLDLLDDARASIIGIQEGSDDIREAMLAHLGKTWECYRRAKVGILYDGAKWERLAGHQWDIDNEDQADRRLVFVWLRSRSTGGVIWVGNSHFGVHYSDPDGPGPKVGEQEERRNQAADVIRKMKEIVKDEPFVMLGDFNDTPPVGKPGVRDVMAKAGLLGLRERLSGAKVDGDTVDTHNGWKKTDRDGRWIDEIFTSKTARPLDARVIVADPTGKFPYATDHNALFARIEVKGQDPSPAAPEVPEAAEPEGDPVATTSAPSALYGVFKQIDPYFKSVVMGGVVGDAKHGSGYHLSRNALKARGLDGDYSIQCPADQDGGGSYAAAIDLTFRDLAELIVCHKRLRAACTPDKDGNYDPRIEPVREIIGTLDGRNVSGYNRVSTGSGTRSRVGWVASGYSDSSHLWHEHISVLRRYVNDKNRMTGLAEVIAGVKAGTLGWKDPSGGTPPILNPDTGQAVPVEKPKPTFLPAYVVDPAKVETYLYGVDHDSGEAVKQRAPGFVISTGTKIISVGGRDWLLTEAGYRYALDFLALKSEFEARPEPKPPVVVDREAVRLALESVPELVSGEPVTGTITALLKALDAEAKARGFEVKA